MTNSTSIGMKLLRLWPYICIPPVLGFITPPLAYFMIYTTVFGIPPTLVLHEVMTMQFKPGVNLFGTEIFAVLPFLGLSGLVAFLHPLSRRRLYFILIFGFLGAALPCVTNYVWFFYPGFESSMNALAIPATLVISIFTVALGLGVGTGLSYLPFVNRVLGPTDAPAYKSSIVILPVIFAILMTASMAHYGAIVSPERRDEWIARRYFAFGQDAYLRRDFESSAGLFKTSAGFFKSECEVGDKAGCMWLVSVAGKMNDLEGKPLYLTACNHHNWDGCNYLALIEYQAGNKKRSDELFQKACDKGMMAACSNLGVNYFMVHQYKEAERLSKLACDNKNAYGCYTLGSLYDRQGDRKKGIAHYQLACDYGQANGCTAVKELQAKKK